MRAILLGCCPGLSDMLGGPCLAAQPLVVQWSGRVHSVFAITSLRSFGQCAVAPGKAVPASAAPRPLPAAFCGKTPSIGGWTPSKAAGGRAASWRTGSAAQELRTAATASAPAGGAPRAIQPGEVHLWWLDPAQVSTEAELLRFSSLLSEEELRECHSAADLAVRRERVLARAHVRSVLASYLEGTPDPRTLLFERNTHGKPRLLWPALTPGGHTLRFNLTHTASLIGLAISVDGLVGLDVEAAERRTRSNPMRLAARRFSDQEIADLQACPDEASRAAYFLQLWTLKESYVKALGRGISAPPGLRSFSFRVGGQQQQVSRDRQAEQQQQPGQGSQGWQQRAEQQLARQHRLEHQFAAPATAGATGSWLDDPPGLGQQGRRSSGSQQRQMGWATSSTSTLAGDASGMDSSDGSCTGGGYLSGSDASSSGMDAGAQGSAVIGFQTTVPDPRRWQFALLQPAPGHIAALCVECSGDHSMDSVDLSSDDISSTSARSTECIDGMGCGSSSSLSSSTDCSTQRGAPLQVLNFRVHPAALPGNGAGGGAGLANPPVLAEGSYAP